MAYETVIGLEVHAQLRTNTKLFCGCTTRFGAPANAQTCEVCLGMPGTLPVLNEGAVTLALRAALGLGCTVKSFSQWSRKNYFYPDLPKGYHITQFDHPYALGGELVFDVDGTRHACNLTRIHMEEDAGKNVHDDALAGRRSYVDFNRGGTPLIEIVSEPDMRSSAQAVAYLKTLRQLLRYLGVCDGNMEQGSLRCDANVSLRKVGADAYGTRVELKNINSFRFVQQAIDFEVARQAAVLDAGGVIAQETRLWDTQAKETRSMRSKEEAFDYRYFPEPDLPDLHLTEEDIDSVRRTLPELPQQKRARYEQQLGLSAYDAAVLTDDADVASFFEGACAHTDNYKALANWTLNDVLREVKTTPFEALKVTGEALGELVAMIDEGKISGKIAKDVFATLLAEGGSAREVVASRGLTQQSDSSAIEGFVDQVVQAHADSVEKVRAGKINVLGFLVGQVMQVSGGKANPKMVSELLRRKILGD